MESIAIISVAAALVLALLVVVIIRERKIVALSSRNAALEAVIKAEEDADKRVEAEREKAFESQRRQMEASFQALSEQNSAGLRRQNAESLGDILKPIQEKFAGFEKQLQESREKSAEQNAALKESIVNVMTQARTVGDEARNLANALTGRSKVQGDFGEMLLVDLLKQSGLEEGIHFVSQGVLRDEFGHEIKSENGAAMIPDIVINYPDGGQVVVDSKVSLSAYVAYANATTAEERKRFAKEHVASVSRHVDELKTKDYASYISDSRKKVDYNIMFIPMENAYRLMLDEAPTLWQQAKDAKVLIVSQQNLMIVLNMILMSWKQHDQEKNIADVYSTAEELMGQLKNWLDSFVKVGDNIRRASEAYEESKKKLCESNQSVIRKIDKLERLKVSPKRSNAKLKAGSRMVGGNESVIPSELAAGLGQETTYNENE